MKYCIVESYNFFLTVSCDKGFSGNDLKVFKDQLAASSSSKLITPTLWGLSMYFFKPKGDKQATSCGQFWSSRAESLDSLKGLQLAKANV